MPREGLGARTCRVLRHPALVWAAVALLVLFGMASRIHSARVWKELDGDDNLFALTAREFARHSRLFYPVKYEFRKEVPYKTFASPATQHPPLYPLLGGLLAKIARTDNTFACLQTISCLAGFGVLLLGWRLARRLNGEAAGLFSLALSAVSVTLIFYSVKASPYMLLACINLAILSIVEYLPVLSRKQAVLLGALAAAGLLLHSCMFGTLAALGILLVFLARRFWRTLNLPLIALTFALLLLPYIAWNYWHLKAPFSSYSTTYFLMINHLTTPGIEDGKLVYLRIHKPMAEVLVGFARSTIVASGIYISTVARTIGVGTLLLAAVALPWLWVRRRLVLVAAILIIVCQVLISSSVGIYRGRFSVPVLPILFLFAGIGFGVLLAWRWQTRVLAVVLAAITFWLHGLTYYLDHDKFFSEGGWGQQVTYQEMRKLTARMQKELQPGVILGAAKLLDGGLETNYWLQWPYVHGKEMYGPKWTPMLAHDFDVKYVWCDRHNGRKVQAWIPDYRSIMMDEQFVIFAKRPDVETSGTQLSSRETTGTKKLNQIPAKS